MRNLLWLLGRYAPEEGGKTMKSGLRILLFLTVLVLLYSPSSATPDSVVTEVQIDDEGIRVGQSKLETHETSRAEGKVTVIGEDVVRIGDDVFVDKDEVIEGDVVAIFGDVICEGTIEGDAVSVGGSIDVSESGEIKGDAVAVLGMVTKEPGGMVRGQTVSVGRGTATRPRFHPLGGVGGGIFSRGWQLAGKLAFTVLLIIVGALIIAVAGVGVDRVTDAATKSAFKMGLIGLLAEVIIAAVIAVFAITIIGIPISMLVALGALVAFLLGYTGVSVAIGRRWGNHSERSKYVSLMIGVVFLQALTILGGILRLSGGAVGAFGYVASLIGWAVVYVAATVGLGAVVMSRFGTRPVKD